ncbi:MAG: glycosyltransferase, partial [Myxococcota bacterium]
MSAPVCVAIVTRERPDSLERCISSLRQQVDFGPMRILVVDNDSQQSAKALCEKLSVDYVHEPRTGIPFARNRAIASLSPHEDLAFIDDDEEAEPRWLSELIRTRDVYRADAVGGPVISLFTSPPPSWVVQGRVFERPRRPTGSIVSAVYTGNMLVTSRVLRELSRPFFCERMALTGGSDGHFAKRLAVGGYTMVWCDEAICYERVAPTRINLAWLLRRSYRIGLNRAFIDRDLALGLDGYTRTAGRALHYLGYGSAAFLAYGWQGP